MFKPTILIFIASLNFGLAQSVSEFLPEDYLRVSPSRPNKSAPTSPNYSDMGDQIILGDYSENTSNPIRLDIYQHFYYTNTSRFVGPFTDVFGAPITLTDEDEDAYSFTRLELEWLPKIDENWYLLLELTQDFVRYNSGENIGNPGAVPIDPRKFDYESTTAGLGIIHLAPQWGDTAFCLSYEYDRVTLGSYNDKARASHRIKFGAQKSLWAEGNNNLRLVFNSNFELSATAQKHDSYSIQIQNTWTPLDKVELTTYYQIELNDFQNFDMWSNYLGADAHYHVAKYLSLYVSASYQHHNVADNGFGVDYDGYTLGTGIQSTIHF